MLLLLWVFIHQLSPLVYISAIAVISKMAFRRKMLVCSPKAVLTFSTWLREKWNRQFLGRRRWLLPRNVSKNVCSTPSTPSRMELHVVFLNFPRVLWFSSLPPPHQRLQGGGTMPSKVPLKERKGRGLWSWSILQRDPRHLPKGLVVSARQVPDTLSCMGCLRAVQVASWHPEFLCFCNLPGPISPLIS